MKKLATICFLSCIGLFSFAQNIDNKWSIELQGGRNEYYGDLEKQFFFKGDPHLFGGLSLNHYLSRTFDLGISSTAGKWAGAATATYYTIKFSGILIDGSVNLKFKLNNGWVLSENSKLAPYITAGLGFGYFGNYIAYPWANPNNTLAAATQANPKSGSNIVIPIGVGLKYNFSKKVALQYQLTFNANQSDVRDNLSNKIFSVKSGRVPADGKNDNYLKHSVALVFTFGTPKDTDHDGVIDRLDLCPNTPAMVSVTPTGCPIDTDGDGVPDYLDKCPNTLPNTKVTEAGCPVDTDGDGVEDAFDKCPNEKGLISLGGCPDSDNDGVADKDDKCPNTPANVKVDAKGCPIDTDGDGIPDYLDKCPNAKGTKAMNGCPDRDGDGIADDVDKCPDVKGTKANKGCPEIKQEVKEVFKKALQGIQFETGKDVIRKSSNVILDNIVEIMKMNPAYKITINGHTDNVGKPESNLILSQKRADAVKKYMTDKGVSGDRMTAVGHGDTMPVADNTTPAGRTQNRRVEFIVEF